SGLGDAQTPSRLGGARKRRIGVLTQGREVSHLPARSTLCLSIEMKGDHWQRERISRCIDAPAVSDMIAQEIGHRGGAEKDGLGKWKTADCSELHLELRDRARLPGVVTGVVRPWG